MTIKFLVVDDEREVLEEIVRILETHFGDSELLSTSIAREAKTILETDIIDILLTDIRMPEIDGFELSKIAKAANPDCRVVFLTGYNDFEFAYNAIKSKCDDFILKINSESEIVVSIQNIIDSMRRDKEKQEMLLEAEHLRLLSSSSDRPETNVIDAIKLFINENIHKNVSLNMLSEKVYLSPAYLSRTFKSAVGMTLTDYLLYVRISKAKEMLLNSNVKIQDISGEVGIMSPVYFSRIFRQKVGVSPMEYRQNNIKLKPHT
jgi:YesN/AraC family two-component response regulator